MNKIINRGKIAASCGNPTYSSSKKNGSTPRRETWTYTCKCMIVRTYNDNDEWTEKFSNLCDDHNDVEVVFENPN